MWICKMLPHKSSQKLNEFKKNANMLISQEKELDQKGPPNFVTEFTPPTKVIWEAQCK